MLYLNYSGVDTYHGDNKIPVSFNGVGDILTMIDIRVQEDIINSWNKPFLNIPDSILAVEFDINNSNKEKSPFFVNDMSFEYLSEHNNKHMDTYVPDIRIDPFPVPFAIQQSNTRIEAQSGTFVAYSLDSCPQDDTGCGKFDYLDLITIQERYIRFLAENGADRERFLFPIYLSKNFIGQIRDELKTLNIKTGKFYPELSKIFDDTNSDGLNDGI